MICPKCKNETEFVLQEKLLMCPICGYLFVTNSKDKKQKKEVEKKNLPQGKKFNVGFL